jgi:hypothetical protein
MFFVLRQVKIHLRVEGGNLSACDAQADPAVSGRGQIRMRAGARVLKKPN